MVLRAAIGDTVSALKVPGSFWYLSRRYGDAPMIREERAAVVVIKETENRQRKPTPSIAKTMMMVMIEVPLSQSSTLCWQPKSRRDNLLRISSAVFLRTYRLKYGTPYSISLSNREVLTQSSPVLPLCIASPLFRH